MNTDIVIDDELKTREANTGIRNRLEIERQLRIADVHHDLQRQFRQFAARYFGNLGFQQAVVDFAEAFEMECLAMKRVRNEMGLTNVEIMIPFVRTLGQAEKVIGLLGKNGLKRGQDGLRVIMMCEVPSNAILAEQFLEHFDGFSIGSNDLTQLTLGLDRDSGMELLAADFDERDPAVLALLSQAIATCRAKGKYVGICGQGPSDHPDFAEWLMKQGIESISLNPDTVIDTWQALAAIK
jgi:pyruvate,water dikinase